MTAQAAALTGVERAAVRPILRQGPLFWLILVALEFLVVLGLVAYLIQFRQGLGVTGLNQQVSWGFYISDMVFFIGISYGGAMTSAILRLTNAPWRAPLTRLAEAMAVAALLVGAVFPLVDLGRPDRFLNVIRYAQVGSPVVWDVVAISTYMVASIVFLYLPLIPDIAFCRDRLGHGVGGLQRFLYTRLSLGWQGTARQRQLLQSNTAIIAVIIVPLAVSVHSVLAWLFGVTMRPGWDSTIFGPYFVLGAMFSGVAAVILVLAAFRKAYRLEELITDQHFKYLANILLALGLGYGYFMFSEYLTVGYKMHEPEGNLLELLMIGRLAPFFWLFVVGGLLVPTALISLPITRNVAGISLASLAVVLGMWLKRFLIVVPGLAEPIMPTELTIYWPSPIEIAITVGAAAAIPLILMIFFRFFPIISIYEMEEAAEAGHRKELPGTPVPEPDWP